MMPSTITFWLVQEYGLHLDLKLSHLAADVTLCLCKTKLSFAHCGEIDGRDNDVDDNEIPIMDRIEARGPFKVEVRFDSSP